jgi:septal ring factor EnvC (AmiA/AmiB activator)
LTPKGFRLGAAGVLGLLLLVQPLPAQTPQSATEAEKVERERELEIIRGDLEARRKAEASLKAEIEALSGDRKKLSQTLIDTAARLKAIEGRIDAAEVRLKPLDAREAEIKRSLEGREAILAEVLAAAARLSRRPAPAILLRPADALDSVRSAILLGAIVPELRSEAETLVADLAELDRVRKDIVAERTALAGNQAELTSERTRLSALVEERQRNQADREKALEGERARVQALAKQAQTVAELVARMEKEIESARLAAEAARKKAEAEAARREAEAAKRLAQAEAARKKAEAEAEEAKRKAEAKALADAAKREAEAEAARRRAEAEAAKRAAEEAKRAAEAEAARRKDEERKAVAALSDSNRISPALPFAEAKGRLPLPVAGTRVRDFGEPDGSGGTEKGILVSARAGAQVTAPCDGWIVYAGLFRSYGRLLIINGGGGYHVLLAGMEQITVELGQFVLTGEPIAVMGGGGGNAANAAKNPQLGLYIEFRKDGISIDPAPWWAESDKEKARG